MDRWLKIGISSNPSSEVMVDTNAKTKTGIAGRNAERFASR
jgi:hypothetical protein